MADENVGPSTSILEDPSSVWPAGTMTCEALGQPLERNGGRLRIVVRGSLQGSAYQAVCSAELGERLQHCTPLHRLRRDFQGSASS